MGIFSHAVEVFTFRTVLFKRKVFAVPGGDLHSIVQVYHIILDFTPKKIANIFLVLALEN